MTTLTTVLILGSEPIGRPTTNANPEFRAIESALRSGTHSRSFNSHRKTGAQVDDLVPEILYHSPTIVHFVGHSDEEGQLVFEDQNGRPFFADKAHVAAVFRTLHDPVRCVVLSACYSADQAELIAEHVELVIGLPAKILPEVAAVFSWTFYAALANGRSAQEAFDLAKNQPGLVGLDIEAQPVLFVRQDIDASRSYFHINGLPPAIVARELLDSANKAISAQTEQAVTAGEAGAFAFALEDRRLAYEQAARVHQVAPSDDSARTMVLAEYHYGSALLEQGLRRQGIDRLVELAKRALATEVHLGTEVAGSLLLSLAQLGHAALARQLLEIVELESERLNLVLDIAESKLPEVSPDDAFLCTQIGFAHERRGDFREATRLAVAILGASDVTTVARVNACLLLGRAIYATAVQAGDALTFIAVDDRFSAIELFTKLLVDLRDACANANRGTRIALEEIALVVQGCTLDSQGEEQSRKRLAELFDDQSLGVEEDADDSNEAALTRAEPWMAEYKSLTQLFTEQRLDEATLRVRELATRYPNIHVFHWHAAQLTASEERTGFARRAYDLVPGVGQARRLAECLLHEDGYGEARDLLEPFLTRRAHDDDRQLLRVAAWSIRRSDPGRAAGLFARHLQLEPSLQPSDLVCYADILQSLSRWEAYDAVVDRALGLELEPALVIGLAESLLAHGHHEPKIEARLRGIYDRLGEYRKDTAAEACRLHIYLALGSPLDLVGPNYPSLIEAGVMESVPMAQVSERLQQWRQWQSNVWTAWRNGWIPFASFQRATGLESAQLLHRMISRREGDEPLLIPPFVHPITKPPELNLEGRHVVLGDLEIALLLELGVWDRLLERLGDDGKLIMFEEIWENNIRDSATRIRRAAQPVARNRERALLASLRQWRKVRGVSQHGEALVPIEGASAGDNVASVYDLLEVLVRERWLARSELRGTWPEGRRRWESTPSRLSLDYAALSILDQAGVLARVIEYPAIKDVVVAPSVLDGIQRRIDELDEPFEASKRAEAIKMAVLSAREAGRLELVPQPRAAVDDELPPAIGEQWEGFREQSIEILSWRRYLADNPRALLLSADHVVTAGSVRANFGIAHVLAWSSKQHVFTFMSGLFNVSKRVLSFAEFVESLAADNDKLDVVFRLTHWGLPGAMYPAHILAFAEQYSGLSGPHMQRVFDQYEWLARTGRDAVASTQSHVCVVYANAIWLAWCGEQGRRLREEVRDDLCLELCRRIAALAPEEPGMLMRRFFDWLLVIAASAQNWVFSTVDANGELNDETTLGGPERTLLMDVRSHAGRLWTWLKAWVAQSDARRRAWNMGLQSAATQIMGSVGKGAIMAEIIYLAGRAVCPTNPAALNLIPMRHIIMLASQAAASHSPLTSTGFVLASGEMTRAVTWADALDILADENTRIRWKAPWEATGEVELGDGVCWISGPPELVLLRGASEGRAERLAAWAAEIAPYDGQLATAALACARTNFEAQSVDAFLLAAVRSPWHSKDDDVLGPAAWGAFADIDYPASLSDLEALLLEDVARYEPLDFDSKASDGGPYDGLVSGPLVRQISQLPGLTRLEGLAHRERFEDKEVAYAWKTLDHAIAGVSADLAEAIVILLRHIPTCGADQGTLRQHLAERLAKVLTDEIEAESDGSTLCAAVLERQLLGRCKQTVVRLVQSSKRTVAPHQVVWLSWRLFQWWWTRLSETSIAPRQSSLAHLLSLAPTHDLSRAGAGIVLDPDRFGVVDGWNHRLASVLMAMCLGYQLGVRDDDAHRGLTLTHDALESVLRGLATRALTAAERQLRAVAGHTSPLRWFGAVAVPDLALEVMLRLLPGALARTPEATRADWYREYLVDDPETPACSWLVRDALVRAIVADNLTAELEDLELGELRPPTWEPE